MNSPRRFTMLRRAGLAAVAGAALAASCASPLLAAPPDVRIGTTLNIVDAGRGPVGTTIVITAQLGTPQGHSVPNEFIQFAVKNRGRLHGIGRARTSNAAAQIRYRLRDGDQAFVARFIGSPSLRGSLSDPWAVQPLEQAPGGGGGFTVNPTPTTPTGGGGGPTVHPAPNGVAAAVITVADVIIPKGAASIIFSARLARTDNQQPLAGETLSFETTEFGSGTAITDGDGVARLTVAIPRGHVGIVSSGRIGVIYAGFPGRAGRANGIGKLTWA